MVVIAKPLKLKKAAAVPPVKKEALKPLQELKPSMTAAQLAYKAVHTKRITDKAEAGEDQSYRQKVLKFNRRLASYSDHFDLQKTSD